MKQRHDPEGLRLPVKIDSTSNGEFQPIAIWNHGCNPVLVDDLCGIRPDQLVKKLIEHTPVSSNISMPAVRPLIAQARPTWFG